ncbi:MAG TPA: hypothetical protein VL131_09145 [Gammaproteobacteria bacterium]|nr:hypothetical protein [Gammaproteobacteria bacterium]
MPNHDRNRHATTRLPVAQVSLLLGVAALAACAGDSKVTSAWADNATHKQSFARVMVVGVSPDVDTRCPFERSLVAKIKKGGTAAFASCDSVKKKNPLTRESIEEAVAAKNADAVLATSLVSKQWEIKDGGSYDTRGGAFYKPVDSYYGVYGAPVVYADFQAIDSILSAKGEAHVTSKLYETHGATVVYSVDTKVRNISSSDAGIAAITTPIAQRLRRDGLIR